MSALHLDHLSFSYTSAVSLFTDVSVHIGDGWTGLVGANGAGKTTLLRLITGDLTADSGSVSTDPRDGHVVIVHQNVDDAGDAVERLALATDGVARRWMGALRLDPAELQRWQTLSPGERKRWQLGAALAAEPDVVLLDEPTNHIDTEARDIIVGALRRFGGVGLIVSHDRTLLDDLTTRTLRVERGDVRLWNGSYTVAREGWEAEAAAHGEAYAKVRRHERATARRLADERRTADARNASRRREVRRAGVADHDARSVEAKARHEGGSAAAGQRMSGLRAELDRTRSAAGAFDIERALGGPIFVDYEPSPKRILLRHTGPLRAGDTVLVEQADVVIERSDRIRLTGPNGAGKSTLLAALMAGASIAQDHLLHLPQELSGQDRQALIDRLGALPAGERGEVLSIVALLGVDPDDLLASEQLSPGESRKLALAFGMGTNAWGLLLDEPTNHFDLLSVERLEAALDTYPGALLVVTHDGHFAAATTTTTWHLEDGQLST
jgi:ATPase subunit of ABC transporter with duplicated ATPase domains